jgi:hypothetical protein
MHRRYRQYKFNIANAGRFAGHVKVKGFFFLDKPDLPTSMKQRTFPEHFI